MSPNLGLHVYGRTSRVGAGTNRTTDSDVHGGLSCKADRNNATSSHAGTWKLRVILEPVIAHHQHSANTCKPSSSSSPAMHFFQQA